MNHPMSDKKISAPVKAADICCSSSEIDPALLPCPKNRLVLMGLDEDASSINIAPCRSIGTAYPPIAPSEIHNELQDRCWMSQGTSS